MRIINGQIITADRVYQDHDLLLDDGQILAVQPATTGNDPVLDAAGMWVAPGMIDIHVHGAAGHDTMDATPQALHGMARYFAQHGVTSYYPTTMSAPAADILAALENVRRSPQPEDGAQHLGVHIEGPYLSHDFPGAQPIDVLRPPDPAEYEAWFASGIVHLITIAPELEGMERLIDRARQHDIELAVGHSGASYEQVLQAAERGVRQATHTYNGMLGLHHREPGTLGAVLTDERLYAQIIVDGIHVHPAMVKLLLRAKTPQRTILITDAMPATGLHDGDYHLGEQAIRVSGGIARTLDGHLAGSTMPMDQMLRNLIAFTGLSLAEALPMASSVPAEAMHLSGRKGVIAPGADADLIFLDDQLKVCLTMIGGRVVYRA